MGERENIIAVVRDHLIRARKSLEASKILIENGLFEDTISRAYYASFHCMQALLISIGEEAKSHRRLQHLVYVHFVRSDIMTTELHKSISHLLTYRGDADYGIVPMFDRKEAEEGIATASELMSMTTKWLEEKFESKFT